MRSTQPSMATRTAHRTLGKLPGDGPGAPIGPAREPPSRPGPPAAAAARRWSRAAAVFAAGLALGWLAHQADPSRSLASVAAAVAGAAGFGADVEHDPHPVRLRAHGLAHPLLACESSGDDPAVARVRRSAEEAIAAARSGHGLARASVVYRDLDSGHGFAIGADQVYRPASLLKMTLAMAWLRRVTTQPAALEQRLLWQQQTQREDNGPQALVHGQTYTVRELLERMICWSRNDAKGLLAQGLGEAELRAAYAALEVPWPYSTPDQDAAITVEQFAKILQTLYDASWLEPDPSDYLLRLLLRSEHRAGLPAGVPKAVDVAHKWGHRAVPGAPPARAHQFHDCGIVYLPGKPTLLCVMTEGATEAGLVAAVAEITRQTLGGAP